MGVSYSTSLSSAEELYTFYESLGWNDFLQLNKDQLVQAMKQSWYVIYVYEGEKLVGTGRVVSDGVINAYLCGIGVDPSYQNKGIGTEISNRLVEVCKNNRLHIQLFCEEELESYYMNKGFEKFAIGMKAITYTSNPFDSKS